MRVFALELNNDIKGIPERKRYIESLIAKLDTPDLVVLPELALCSYLASPEIWQYADDCGRDASAWAVSVAQKYRTFLGAGYIDRENGDYYNRYLIAGPDGVCGSVSKSEGETAVFKTGWFGNVIRTPFGNVGVAICYDAKRKHFYENVKDEELSLILFPHGCPADPKKPEAEHETNDYFCNLYAEAFGVPVVYANSKGKLEYMPGKMGAMMARAGFTMNGMSRIYGEGCHPIETLVPEAVACEVPVKANILRHELRFYGQDLIKGNRLFRKFILEPDAKAGKKYYEKNQV